MSNIPPPYKPPAASAPSAPPAASAIPPAYKASAPTPAAVPAGITSEGVMQRLRYFENLTGQYEHYIEVLQAQIRRLGAAPPTGYFAPLKGEGGSYTPKVS